MVNFKELFDRILLECKYIEESDLMKINQYGIENPVSKIIILFYAYNISTQEEKKEFEKEIWQLSKEISAIINELILKGEMIKAKEITNIKNRTLSCFLKIEKYTIEEISLKEKNKKIVVKKIVKKKEKKRGSFRYFFLILPFILILLIVVLNKRFENKFLLTGEEKIVEFKDYDLSHNLESVKPLASFKNDDSLYIIIENEDKIKLKNLKEELSNKYSGIAKYIVIQDENGNVLTSIKMDS